MNKAKIMIVEDMRITAEDLKETLEDQGFCVSDIASNGASALSAAAERRPDLVLMDIMLKGKMDGIECARRLRERWSIPIIYLTAHSDGDILDRAKRTQPYGFLVKPYSEEELNSMIVITLHKVEFEKRKTLTAFPTGSPEHWDFSGQLQRISTLPAGREKMRLFQAVNQINARRKKLLYIQGKARHCALILDSPREPSHDLKITFQELLAYCLEPPLVKVHRSYLVVANRVLYVKKKSTRDYELWLKNYSGEPRAVPMARSLYAPLKQAYPHWF